MSSIVALFWLSVACASSSYVIYPALLCLFKVRQRQMVSGTSLPPLSIIIAARNEAGRIQQKLEATLALEYPSELVEIIVASDASDDDTDTLAQRYRERGVKLARTPTRAGKEAAQANAIKQSLGEILVFTDSATRLDPDALLQIAEAYKDPSVGAVSSVDQLEGTNTVHEKSSEGVYVRYEMWLRQLESDRAGLVGLSGSLFSVRREIAIEDWPTKVPSDITAAMLTVQKGFRSISLPNLFGYYADIQNPEKEYARKVRTVMRGMAAVYERRTLLNPFKFGLFSFQLWGHKIMRWLTPVFLVPLLILSSILANHGGIFLIVCLSQYVFYIIVFAAWLIPNLRNKHPFKFAYYLFLVHMAMIDAGIRFLKGERVVFWNPSVR